MSLNIISKINLTIYGKITIKIANHSTPSQEAAGIKNFQMERKDLMDETPWDIQEVKRLKKIQLVQGNLVMLLIFVLLVYFADSEQYLFIIGTFFVVIWVVVAIALYTLLTGRFIGTKTSKRVQEFDRQRSGEKPWKRKKIIEAVVVSAIGIGIAVLLFVTDFDSISLDFPFSSLPFIGAWVGYNLGEIIRTSNLQEQPKQT